jgi:hypothetical protein
MTQQIKLLKEKIDLAQLELLLKEDERGKAGASAEKAEATPSGEAFKSVAKRSTKQQRTEHWPKDLAVEQEVSSPRK